MNSCEIWNLIPTVLLIQIAVWKNNYQKNWWISITKWIWIYDKTKLYFNVIIVLLHNKGDEQKSSIIS